MHYRYETYEAQASIGYLVKRCGTLIAASAEKAFEGDTLSFTQWVVLIRLRSHGKPMKATELSEWLGHDPGALTRVVDSLERQGFVKRERSRSDRRVVTIELTPSGRVEAEQALRKVIDMLNELLEPFSPEEVKTLTTLLQRLLARLQECSGSQPEDTP